jgi:hypothetical protein
MANQELWSFNNALFFLILLIVIGFILIYGISTVFDVKKIKDNWSENRCSPGIMPFAGLFGFNTKENFEFCMGKIFNTYAQPYFGSSATMFSGFTSLLTIIFGSIGSLRNTIATLGGGINTVFQEFTDRISSFFFKLRLSAIRIKTLIGRMYAILFSVMYMGMSGITGMMSFTNTFLFSFLNTFCFPAETQIEVKGKGKIAIKDIKINDILLPTNSIVTGLFKFYSKGQPMVKIGEVTVSTNHYVEYKNKYIKAGDHPEAEDIGIWELDTPLYCLDTHNNKIPVNNLIFLDYDETIDGDNDTMNYIQNTVNASKKHNKYNFKEYSPAISESTLIKTKLGNKLAKDIVIGDELVTGSKVVGCIRRKIDEVCKLEDGTIITPSTLYWNEKMNEWERIGETNKVIKDTSEVVSFIVVPNSQIELENGIRIRDYMELCSPDSEMYYSKCLEIRNGD